MTARIVPLGGDWMLSGAQTLFPASERARDAPAGRRTGHRAL